MTYNWKKKKDVDSSITGYYEEGSEDPVLGHTYGTKLHGFIAQECKTAIDNHSDSFGDGFNLWRQGDHGMQTIAQGELVPMLVKAIQELSAQNAALTARIEALES